MNHSAFPVVIALGILLQTGIFSLWNSSSKAAEKPNIIYILADDLGYAELGCYGQKKIRTPHLDLLANQGMKFLDHYCGAPVCAPSRCVLMTGKHLGHAYIRNNSEVKPEGQTPIPAEEVTIAELLKKAGYKTAAIGKWGLGPVNSSGDPLNQGFDLFFGYNCQRHAHSYYPDYLWHNRKRIPLKNNPAVPGHAALKKGDDPNDPKSYEPFKGTDYTPDRMISQALSFIKENKDDPFFLYYPSPIPHVALHIPDEELKPYLGKWRETPFVGGRGYTPHQTPKAAYAAMISRLDQEVGMMMSLLKELDLEENTLVMFSSDNGTTHLDREVDAKFFESVGSLRGLKGSVYEGGIRVPMIARWPGKIKPGSVSDHVSAFYDVMPTLCEIVGIDAPHNCDGISFASTLLGSKSQKQHKFLLWEFYGYGGQQAVRMGDWKGVRQNCHRDIKGPVDLYDLSKDIGEQKNVAAQHPDVVQKIEQIMKEEHTPSDLWNFRSSVKGKKQ